VTTPRIRYGRSPWLDRAPRQARPAHPRLTDDRTAPVAIVGGGLTGAAAAYTFAAAGVRAILLEAGRVGEGATAASAGLLLQHPGDSYLEIESAHGRRAARALWQSTRRAALDLAATIRRLGARVGYAPADAVLFGANAAAALSLKRELAARRAAGLEATWLTPRGLGALGLPGVNGAIKTTGNAVVDPYRVCQALTRAAVKRGALVCEQTAVTRVKIGRTGVDVETGRATVRCQTVVLATGEPTAEFSALRRHFVRRETYLVMTPPLPGRLKAGLSPSGVVLEDRHAPPHRLAWTPDDRIIWSGADQDRTPDRARDRVLVQRTGQLMYELSLLHPAISGIQPEYGWHAEYSATQDGLPFIGPHRNYPRHLFAFGHGTTLASALLAARILLRHHQGQPDKEDAYFGFARISGR